MCTTGCSRGPSGETKGVYVLFFLLSSLLLMSLAAACALYGRHRRGSFPLKGQPSRSDGRFADATASDPLPPPPPVRGPRDSWALHKVLVATSNHTTPPPPSPYFWLGPHDFALYQAWLLCFLAFCVGVAGKVNDFPHESKMRMTSVRLTVTYARSDVPPWIFRCSASAR